MDDLVPGPWPAVGLNSHLTAFLLLGISLSSPFMAYRTLEITLISAKGLKAVNIFSKMTVYAVVSVSCDHRSKQRTPTDREGGRSPSWNSTFHVTVPVDGGAAGGHSLYILLRTQRPLGDRVVGEVRVPLAELLAGDPGDGSRPVQFVTYQVRRMTSGKPKGVLNFSYKFSQPVVAAAAPPALYLPSVTAYPEAPAGAHPYPYGAPFPSKADEPVMAYPVWAGTAAYAAYMALPLYRPPYGYMYPTAGYAYGAPPPAMVEPNRKNSMSLKFGTGLLGGALGGLLIGDMVSDAVEYNAGL